MAFALSLGSMVVSIKADAVNFQKNMARVQATLKKTSQWARKYGRSFSLYVTAPIVLAGTAGVKAFMDFDDAMTQSLAIMGNVTAAMRKEMEDVAKSLSKRSITTPRELAESYFYLASAGLNARQSIKALAVVEQFAVAGRFDMTQATDLLTDAQSALGLTVKDSTQNMINMTRISDVLVKANTLANASVEQFSRALTNKAASAMRLLNKDITEGVAVLAAFADQGKKGVEAGQMLHIVLRDLQRASIRNTKAWDAMGMSVFDANGKMLHMADIIKQLEDAFEPMSDRQKKMTAEMLGFQDRSFSAIQVLISMSHKIREYDKALKDAGGTTADVANKQLKSLTSRLKMLKNRLTVIGIEIGEKLEPQIRKLMGHLGELARWWENLDTQHQTAIISIAGLAAAVGPLLIGFGMMAASLKAIGGLLAWIGLPILAVVGALGSLAFAGLMIADAFFDADTGFKKFVEGIRISGFKISTYTTIMATYIWQAWDWVTSSILKLWEKTKNGVIQFGGMMWRFMIKVTNGIVSAFRFMVDKIIGAVEAITETLVGLLLMLDLIDENTALKAMGGKLGKDIDTFFANTLLAQQNAIDESLGHAEKRAFNHFAKMEDLEKAYTADVEKWGAVRQEVVDRDVEGFRKKTAAWREEQEAIRKRNAALGQGTTTTPPPGTGGVGGGGFTMPGGEKSFSLRRMSGISAENISKLGKIGGPKDIIDVLKDILDSDGEGNEILREMAGNLGLAP